jgi:hypothetical protein
MIGSETSAAAAGAALVAAVCLGHYGDVAEGFRDWVAPRLAEVPPAGPVLPAHSAIGAVVPAPNRLEPPA